jgi:hypothetical protein
VADLRRLAALVVIILAVACSDDDSGGGGDAAGATTSSGEASTTTTEASAPTGCGGPAPEMTRPANQGEIVDVDGDGRRDTAWLATPAAGGRELGVLTAAGGGAKVPIESASPVELVLLVVDADDEPPVELLVSDNRTVQLWAFSSAPSSR